MCHQPLNLMHVKKPVDCDKTNAGRSPPWCWDDAAQSVLGMTAPQVMQSATSQLIVVCNFFLVKSAEPPQLLAPTTDSNKT